MPWFRPFALTIAALSVAALSPAAAVETPSPFLSDYLKEVGRVERQISALAGAMPAETYAWRPAEGVRSVSEANLHIAFGNYLLLKLSGHAPPAELADQIDISKIQAWDTWTTEKEAVAARVATSFDHLRSTVAGFSENELAETVEFFGQTITKRQLLLLELGHLHEHLGQLIAYARMNGVVPPWTAAQQAAAAEAAPGN